LDSGAYTRSEQGQRAFKASELVAIADALGVSLDTLVGHANAADVEVMRQARAGIAAAVTAVTELVTRLNRAIDDGADIGELVAAYPATTVTITALDEQEDRPLQIRAAIGQLISSIEIAQQAVVFTTDSEGYYVVSEPG
jgi:transcriptional regulator with XRE-family HTH domain